MLEACSGRSVSVATGFVLVSTEGNAMCAVTFAQMYDDRLCRYLCTFPVESPAGVTLFNIVCEGASPHSDGYKYCMSKTRRNYTISSVQVNESSLELVMSRGEEQSTTACGAYLQKPIHYNEFRRKHGGCLSLPSLCLVLSLCTVLATLCATMIAYAIGKCWLRRRNAQLSTHTTSSGTCRSRVEPLSSRVLSDISNRPSLAMSDDAKVCLECYSSRYSVLTNGANGLMQSITTAEYNVNVHGEAVCGYVCTPRPLYYLRCITFYILYTCAGIGRKGRDAVGDSLHPDAVVKQKRYTRLDSCIVFVSVGVGVCRGETRPMLHIVALACSYFTAVVLSAVSSIIVVIPGGDWLLQNSVEVPHRDVSATAKYHTSYLHVHQTTTERLRLMLSCGTSPEHLFLKPVCSEVNVVNPANVAEFRNPDYTAEMIAYDSIDDPSDPTVIAVNGWARDRILTMSTNGSSMEPYRDHLGGRILCASMSSSSSAESSRSGLSSEGEQVEATNSASSSIVIMPSEEVFGASSLIIDSSLNRIEAMLRNLCKSPSNGSKVIETTVPCDKRDVSKAILRSHKTRSESSKAASLSGCAKTCKERISQDAAKHDKSGKDKDETVKAKGLINASLRSNRPATLILKGIELSDEVELNSPRGRKVLSDALGEPDAVSPVGPSPEEFAPPECPFRNSLNVNICWSIIAYFPTWATLFFDLNITASPDRALGEGVDRLMSPEAPSSRLDAQLEVNREKQ
ncbi:unnamed protein product [Toxocara canis]|uniref:CUB domain-containing protein n=1 Tax=Toxocara canis TaxID=6265 RepID=A0A183UET9_TOXCA|nr:unnamed protein product [Toxocara canis]